MVLRSLNSPSPHTPIEKQNMRGKEKEQGKRKKRGEFKARKINGKQKEKWEAKRV